MFKFQGVISRFWEATYYPANGGVLSWVIWIAGSSSIMSSYDFLPLVIDLNRSYDQKWAQTDKNGTREQNNISKK